MTPLSKTIVGIVAVAIALILLLRLQGCTREQDAVFNAAAKAAEDTAAVLLPLMNAEKTRADSADARRQRAEQRVSQAESRADSIANTRQRIIERIRTVTVPEDARQFTEPRDEIIASQQDEIGELRGALTEAHVAFVEADSARSALGMALSLSERRAQVALDALAQRPTRRWYAPKVVVGPSGIVSQRDWQIHYGFGVTVGWTLSL
jgi:hypothetical protein